MKSFHLSTSYIIIAFLTCFTINSLKSTITEDMHRVMHQAKYDHSIWGLYVKDLHDGKILCDLNSQCLFSPASTTKLFSIAALLNTFGGDYRFNTPVFAAGKITNGELHGQLILVAKGDLTMGGRQINQDQISFTKLDHTVANEIPGVILTKEDPLRGIKELAKQVYESGIRTVTGDVIIDDQLFETIQKRDMVLSPIIINENLIDIVLNPTVIGELANLTWKPQAPGYKIENRVITVAGQPSNITISSDDIGHNIIVQGTLSIEQRNMVRTFAIKDPKFFARAAFIHALQNLGIKINLSTEISHLNMPVSSCQDLQQVALWKSPPLYEYAKFILKVSHNLGANLVPLLLASHEGKKTFDEGMRILGDFVIQEIKLAADSFVFVDAAGGNENRLTPQAEVQLLEFIYNGNATKFQYFFDALPILGVDGSLADFGKSTSAAGKVHAKTGTGVTMNLATGNYFLVTQALSGYIKGKNGHLFAYMLVVNNATMPSISDVFTIFEDESKVSNMIYNQTDEQK